MLCSCTLFGGSAVHLTTKCHSQRSAAINRALPGTQREMHMFRGIAGHLTALSGCSTQGSANGCAAGGTAVARAAAHLPPPTP